MVPLRILWDLEDDPDGNVQHLADHGVSREEFEEIIFHPHAFDRSRSTGRHIGQLVEEFLRDLLERFRIEDGDAL